jgi:hypothetical protein
MAKDSLMGLAIAIIVISSIAWVGQWRRIRHRMKMKKAVRAEPQAPAKPSEWPL